MSATYTIMYVATLGLTLISGLGMCSSSCSVMHIRSFVSGGERAGWDSSCRNLVSLGEVFAGGENFPYQS